MIAAIYARKSTDQSAVADEAKSVTRQIEHARAYAAVKGWTVNDAHVYVDDGISGAEFDKRPGFLRLMNALRPRAPFQVLVVSELSRLGREQLATGYACKQLSQAGVKIFGYLDDREVLLATPTDKFLMSAMNFSAEIEQQKARQRAHDAAEQKARRGYVTGGRVFGYDNVDVTGPDGKRSHVERRLIEAEAAVIRRIFALAAAGVGQKAIAITLNTEGSPAPRAQQDRPRAWAQSSVHELLFRSLYRGELVWNRTMKRNSWNQIAVANRPEHEWVRVPAPALRIVDEDLWQAAHARIAEARARYRDATKGLRGGRTRIDSKYLLPGFARCACCNGGMFVSSASHGSGDRRRRAFVYGCTSHHQKGRTVCGNGLRVPMEALDRAVLERLTDVLTPDLVDDVIARVREMLEAPAGSEADHRARVALELAAAELQVEKYAEAIAEAGNIPALARRLREAEDQRQALSRTHQALGEGPIVSRVDWRTLERQARQKVATWRALLARHPTEGRPVLRELLDGPIRFTPFEEAGRRGYRFTGAAALGGLVEGLVLEDNGKWRPHRDSNPGFSLERAAS